MSETLQLKYEGFYRLADEGHNAFYVIADKDYNFLKAIDKHNFIGSKIKESLYHKDFDYNIMIVRVNNKKTSEFEEIAREVARNLTIMNGKNYLEFTKYMEAIINRNSKEGGD